jgi:hypothetical protein
VDRAQSQSAPCPAAGYPPGASYPLGMLRAISALRKACASPPRHRRDRTPRRPPCIDCSACRRWQRKNSRRCGSDRFASARQRCT